MLPDGTEFAGRYRVVRALAMGGMGSVHEVVDNRNGRRRALKVMLPHLARDPATRRRFEAEARVGAQIESDHVVEVLDSGVDDATGMPWLVMELLQGETLEARMDREGPLGPAETARIFDAVGHALGAAHRAGIMHMDLKPANLFLAQPNLVGQPGVVKVLDFGIARLIEFGRTSAELTTGGGTLGWMAPEQADRGQLVRPTVDIWPLGLIAFQMLTGRPYWETENAPAEQFSSRALLMEISVYPLVPASQRAAQWSVGHLLPHGFDAWFARCVVREQDQRWRDADAAVPALLSVLRTAATVPPARPDPSASAPSSVPSGPLTALTGSEATLPSLQAPPASPDPTTAVTAVRPALPSTRSDTQVSEAPPLRVEPVRGQPSWSPPSPASPRRMGTRLLAAVLVLAVLAGIVAVAVFAGPWSDTGVTRRGRVPSTGAPSPGGLGLSTSTVVPAVPAASNCPAGTVWIPAGTFAMGSPPGQGDPDEHPQHPVTLRAFCMDRTEVTVAQYQTCVRAGGCTPAGRSSTASRADLAQHPVNFVDWSQGLAYCRSVGRRLPGEAEWEYAARGIDGRLYPWGNDPPGPTRLNWSGGADGWVLTAPVGSHPAGASAFGVEDLAGNVWEWVAEPLLPYTAPPGTVPVPGTAVIRGGGYDDSDAATVRAANRDQLPLTRQLAVLGFRCATEPTSTR